MSVTSQWPMSEPNMTCRRASIGSLPSSDHADARVFRFTAKKKFRHEVIANVAFVEIRQRAKSSSISVLRGSHRLGIQPRA